ncbi:carbamoyltransferase HypF [Parasporobacterium paucivorans]|uniref:Carbamoyltransferase n=1 Tax=Parasporobacterium paucivorans DSM 15970 TaxID=1122934 RepID=A0A1M6KYB6_9FIRM|nr:carbamoyltransferase HypF [Parasporobacterium paucivorans]SHJ63991.1 hydrogenase maturation protein HypF [Parasporobacterium paucivorans DSM 15970]
MDKRKSKRIIKKIIVSGIVQGVGFRPFVYRVAKKHRVNGTVRNIGGIVEIIASSPEKEFQMFLADLQSNDSGSHEIKNIEISDLTAEDSVLQGFRIIESMQDEKISIIPPDLPVCRNCEKELFEEKDRRFRNPFISCMSCGPRYTIIEELPYDRKNTTMEEFEMCPSCNEEYIDPEDRRFHAQTISCDECGPYLIFRDNDGSEGETRVNYKQRNQESLRRAAAILKAGGIIALKGIGGYHFACSPFLEDAVSNLRMLKGREEKPFAVMFDSLASIEECCHAGEAEKKLLESKARPIVLLYVKEKRMSDAVGKGSMYCGAFLPYTPLQTLLLRECGPLIMTSANISCQPIIKDDEEMLALSSPYLAGVLYNKRGIVRSVDDSVAKVVDSEPQIIRRSRGYVPYPIFLKNRKDIQIFAAGGDLKAAFCLYYKGNAVVSQYFGDLGEHSILKEYEKSYVDLSRLLKVSPDIVLCDLHPNYHSSRFVKSLDNKIIYVQHHHAHIASVMAEHDLTNEKVIGIAFDGTGYGIDGNIWGGEFLVCEGSNFERTGHLEYTPIIGGDSSMKDAKKTAACFLINAGLTEYVEDERAGIIEAAVKNKINTHLTSSMGRLFDAVSAILEIGDKNTYEGECAINLEKEAFLAEKNKKSSGMLRFEIEENDGKIIIKTKSLLESLVRLKEKEDKGTLALSFHHAVSDMILAVCERIRNKQGISSVALSGGVFQNTFLTEEALKKLRLKDFDVYINKAVPPNDGCISLGQTFIGLMR